MKKQELFEKAGVLGPIELNPYRSYYMIKPDAYQDAITCWEEFCDRFEELSIRENMPAEAPTYMNSFLQEDSVFFPNPDDEVALILNAPYCPPFLHRLAFIKVVYVLRGSCYFLMRNERIRMEQGAFCVVGPNVEQSVYSCGDEDIVVNLLIRFDSFAESFLNLMTEQGIMSEFLWRMLYTKTDNGVLMYCGKEKQILTEVVLELCEEILLEKNKSNFIRKSLLMIFYGYVLRLCGEKLNILGRSGRECGYRLPGILHYIRKNLNCNLPEVAEHFQISEGYLSRYIRRETGRTFASLLCEFRIKSAAKLLVNTDFSIDKIVETVGYTEKSRFYRNFSEVYGITPVRYRKQSQRMTQFGNVRERSNG